MSTPVDELPNPFGDDAELASLSQTGPSTAQGTPRGGFGPTGGDTGLSSADNGSLPGSAGARRREKKRVGFRGAAEPEGERSPRNEDAGNGDGSGSGSGGGGETQASSGRGVASPRIGVTPPLDGGVSPPGTSGQTTPNHSRNGSGDLLLPRTGSKSHLPELSPQQTQELHAALNRSLTPTLPVPRPTRPAIRRTSSNQTPDPEFVDPDIDGPDYDGQRAHRQARAREAYERGQRLETDERARSGSNSRYASPERSSGFRRPQFHSDDIPLEDLNGRTSAIESDDSDREASHKDKPRKPFTTEAHNLVRKHTVTGGFPDNGADTPPSGLRSGAVTPTEEHAFFEDYRPQPKQYRGGILGSLLKLYGEQQPGGGGGGGGHHHERSSSRPRSLYGRVTSGDFSTATTPTQSPPDSGASTPTSWFPKKHKTQSTSSLAQLIGSSASLGSPVVTGLGEQVGQRLREQKEQREHEKKRPGYKRGHSSNALAAFNRMSRQHRLENEIKITVHIAETISRQRYLMKLCKALMLYGAPTHRLEEYMNMSARVLEISAQFLYIPGSMIMSFDDLSTHTTEVKLVRVTQGLDLGKLRDVHEVYKDVVHDRVGVEEATQRLDEVNKKRPKHSRWVRIPVYGLAAVCVGPFAFESRLIDLPIAFLLGCIVGVLQLVVSARSDLYANVFEIAATVITSFLARAFGSIPDGKGGRLFCFSALAQSSIALILPGYIVLCASLELQSRSIVAGSIRMVYAIIYSLFLGYGITIGTAMYGIMDRGATSATHCEKPISEPYFFPFVPCFALCLIMINQAKWKQAPIMIVISCVGYIVNFYSAKRFQGNTQVSNTFGAFAIGVMANMYSRVGARVENWLLDLWEDRLRQHWKNFKRRVLRIQARAKKSVKALEEGRAHDGESLYERKTRRVGYGLAAAAMLPAIFVQVPSGLAVSGSLVSGIASADQIAGNATNGTQVLNSTTLASVSDLNSISFSVGYSVIQVAIGITVGLFLSAIVVYPLGKRRSGLFSL